MSTRPIGHRGEVALSRISVSRPSHLIRVLPMALFTTLFGCETDWRAWPEENLVQASPDRVRPGIIPGEFIQR